MYGSELTHSLFFSWFCSVDLRLCLWFDSVLKAPNFWLQILLLQPSARVTRMGVQGSSWTLLPAKWLLIFINLTLIKVPRWNTHISYIHLIIPYIQNTKSLKLCMLLLIRTHKEVKHIFLDVMPSNDNVCQSTYL